MRMEPLSAINFAQRRKTVLSRIKKSVMVIPSAAPSLNYGSIEHPFRQSSNFFYLSGFEEPTSTILLSGASETPFQIFVRPKDKRTELWEGKITGPDQVKKDLGADVALPSTPESHFDEAFVKALSEAECLYYQIGLDEHFDRRIFRLMRQARKVLGRTGRPLWPILDPDDLLGDLRILKSKEELERMQRAATISSEGHIGAMKAARPGMNESEIEAVLYHAFRVHGAEGMAYPAIVASGPNACTLHYRFNNRKMVDRDLLLVDAAASFEHYGADISRTYPISGTFTREQREVYAAVLKAQKECINYTRPGRTQNEVHELAVEVLTEELKRLKVLKGNTAQLIKKKAYYDFYPHQTSHWLGMDTHDVGKYYVGSYEQRRKLEPGIVFTIEPGLYFSPDSPSTPARYRGIGVRIEDDVVVTSQGCRVLSSAVPKEIDEIESLCSK